MEIPSKIELSNLEAIINSSEDAIYSRDLDGKILSWNKAAETIYGYSDEEAIGKNHSKLIPPEITDFENAIFEKVVRGEHLRHYETVRLRKDGSKIQVSLTVSPIVNRNGEIVGISKIARDITEQKDTERALRESESKYRRLFNSIDEGFCAVKMLFDNSGKAIDYYFLEINPAFERLTGIVAEDALSGKPVTEVIPNLEKHWIETFGKVAQTGEPIRFESQSAALNRWFDVYAFRVGETENREVALLFDNITERKLGEGEIRRRERQLRGLIDNLFSFVGLLSTDGILLEANRTALNSANLEPEDVIGKKFADTYWWTWSPKVQKQLQDTITSVAAGETVRYDVVIRLGEDRFMTIDFQIAPMFSESGEIIYLVPSAVDISERLRLESELLRSTKIRLAGELAVGIAHEIKNPLSGIQGAINILINQRESDNPERLILEDVIREIERIDKTVRLLLTKTQLRSTSLERKSLTETVRRAVQVAEHHTSARESKTRIIFHTHFPDAPFILAHDTVQIEDAVLNLLINSLESLGDDAGNITINLLKTQISDEEKAAIEVSDTGKGISEANLANIFTPFYTTKKIGTGLGLSTVKRVAEAHRGHCTVKSVVGQGSTFTMYLPFDT